MRDLACGSQSLKYLLSTLLQKKFANPWSKTILECPDSGRLQIVSPDFPDSHPVSHLIVYPVVCVCSFICFVHMSIHLSNHPSNHSSSCHASIQHLSTSQPPILPHLQPCLSLLCDRCLECKYNHNTAPAPAYHLSVAVFKVYFYRTPIPWDLYRFDLFKELCG